MLLLRNRQGQYWNKGYRTCGWSDNIKPTSLFSSVQGILSSYRTIPEAAKPFTNLPRGGKPDNTAECREWYAQITAAYKVWYGLSTKERLAWLEKDGITVVPFTGQETDK